MILFQLFISCITLLGNISNNTSTSIDDTYSSCDEVSDSEIVTNCQFCEGEENYVTCVDHEREISSNQEIYEFTSNTNIDHVKSSGDCTLISYEKIDTNKIQCTIGNFIDHGEIKLSFYFESEFVDNYTLHFAVSEEGIFYSSGRTLDCARDLAGQNFGCSLNDEDYEDTNIDEEIETYSTTYVSGTINGYFKWTDDQGNVHPLVGAGVEMTINGGESGSTQTMYTNSNGYYSFTYNNVKVKNKDGIASICVSFENEEIKVQTPKPNVYSHEATMADANKSCTYSYTFSPENDGDTGKAASIYQAAQCFSSFALTKDTSSKLKKCTIEYPVDDTKCSYTSGKNKISIIESKPDNSKYPNSYASWDVIGHEYGHHIQNCYDFDDNPGGTHQFGKNAVDYLIEDGKSQSKAKKNGTKLSFEEAWATYWSTAAQESFDEEWKSIETVGNTAYESYKGICEELDTYDGYKNSEKNYGDCDELAIAKILYKLYSSATDDYDKFGLGFDKLFKTMCNYKPLTFSEFANALYDEGYNKNDLGLLFAQYNVVPNSVYVDGGKLETRTCPTFVWSTYMGSNYLYFNKFKFVLQSEYGTELVNATITTTSTTTCSYTLTSSEWVKVRAESYGSYFTVYLVAWQTDYVTTGGYYSELFTFKNTTAYSVRVDE